MVEMPQASLARRLLYIVASFLPVWAVIAFFTGGVGWMLGPIRLSSRQPLRPLLIGVALAGWYIWRYPRDEREADGRWLLRWSGRAVPVAVAAAAALALFAGLRYGSYAAAGSDSYGYLSQARLWLEGTLRLQQPWVEQWSWPNREWMFTPLGYRPSGTEGTIVPTYPAGLPIVMALFLAVFGANGPFYVVPLFGALMVWLTYLLGRQTTSSGGVGALAALLLVTSPVFLAHVTVPMSDIPAAAGWTLVCLLVLKNRTTAAGWAAGASLIIRPNLFLLAMFPVIVWETVPGSVSRASAETDPGTVSLRYAKGLVPALIVIMALNTYLYEGPLTFGYGGILESYTLSAFPANAVNYLRWLLQTQTPLILLAIVPLVVRGALRDEGAGPSPRVCLAALLALTWLSYLFYGVFDDWRYLRFLLPAYPVLFVLVAAAVFWIVRAMPGEARVPAAALVFAAMMVYGVQTGRDNGIFRQAAFEQRHVRAAAEVSSRTPENAVVLSVQHSGSVRYYAGRITMRYDWLPSDRLDAAVHELARQGHPAYLVVDDWEQKEFQSRFAGGNRLGRLGWPPVARVASNPEVRIFELRDGGPAAPQ
jgi:hypothetical protein